MGTEQTGAKIKKVQKGLDEVKEVLVKATEKVMKRGEEIESLVKKTAGLQADSLQFRRTATNAKDKTKETCCCFNFWRHVGEAIEEKITQNKYADQRPGYGSINNSD